MLLEEFWISCTMETNLLITLVDIPCVISPESLEMVEGEKMLQAFLPPTMLMQKKKVCDPHLCFACVRRLVDNMGIFENKIATNH